MQYENAMPGTPLPFEACENFRELGGYKGFGGRRVKHGVFYRSPALANIRTPADKARLEALGIRAVFDFRSSVERSQAPDPALPGARYVPVSALVSEDGGEVEFDLEAIVRSEGGIQRMLEGVHAGYARMAFSNEAYKALFAAVLADETPLLFHCTAGKDRTGVAAALILRTLGVSDEDIVADYLRTNACRAAGRTQVEAMMCAAGLPGEKARALAELAAGVREESIRSTLDAIDARYPDFGAYLEAEYGIGEAQRALLCARYLE